MMVDYWAAGMVDLTDERSVVPMVVSWACWMVDSWDVLMADMTADSRAANLESMRAAVMVALKAAR